MAQKFDFSGIDFNNVDPEKLGMGIGVQDCAIIASTFERGAHTIPTEAAVFSTLTRSVQNKKQFATAAADSLTTYLQSPAETASNILSQSALSFTPTGTTAIGDQTLQGLTLGGTNTTSFTESFGTHLLEWAKDCIPCNLRLTAFLELHPNLDLLGGLESFIKDSIAFINSLLDLLNNFDAFGDFCNLLNMLSFMCIPDLQRILAALMALFLMKATMFDGMIGLLQSLIMPMFAPLLMSITSLLDQFALLVTDPLKCVIDAISAALKSRSFETGYNVSTLNDSNVTAIGGGLVLLQQQIAEAVFAIKEKMAFYTNQVKAMLGELGTGDAAYLRLKMQALTLVRMIAFVIAIITALSKGHAACSTSKTPEKSELDNFFQNFLSPQTPYNLWIDDEGKIHADPKNDAYDVSYLAKDLSGNVSQISASPLSAGGNVVQFEGEPLVDPAVIQEITTKLVSAVHVSAPCKLETSTTDVEKLNAWIDVLNGA